MLTTLLALRPDERDAELERLLNIAVDVRTSPPGHELIGYHASALAPVAAALLETQTNAEDYFVDLGSGLGKVTALARLFTGARVLGVELQAELIDRAVKLDGVEYFHGDVRDAPLEQGTVFYLYNPFSGAVLDQVLTKLRCVAEHHAIVLCTLGLTLGEHPWLRARPLEHFWLQIFDSHLPGVAPRRVLTHAHDPRLERLANSA